MADPRNATASWSWYLHQWKVGIFVALEKIEKLITWKEISEIKDILSNWRLIYENAEDFDIQEKDNNWKWIDKDLTKWKVESRHQVKAYKDWNNLKDYKDVLNKQKYVLSNKWKMILKIRWFQIWRFEKVYPKLNTLALNVEVDKENRFLHTIKEVQWFWLSKFEFNKAKKNWIIRNNPNFVNNPNNIKIFEYPDLNNYCELWLTNKLKVWSDEKISIIKYWNSINFTEAIYEKLLYKLDEKIRNKHSWWWPILNFYYDIYNEIINFEEMNIQEFKYSEYRNQFAYYWQEYKLWLPLTIPKKKIILLDKYLGNVYEKYKTNIDFFNYIKELHFYEDLSINKYPSFNSSWFKEVILTFIISSNLLSIKDLNCLLNNKKLLFSCCSDPVLNKIKPIYNLIKNIENNYLRDSQFSWKDIINEKIDYKIEKYTDINSEISSNWTNFSEITESNFTKSNKTCLVSVWTILNELTK